jgi:hypothetical protein
MMRKASTSQGLADMAERMLPLVKDQFPKSPVWDHPDGGLAYLATVIKLVHVCLPSIKLKFKYSLISDTLAESYRSTPDRQVVSLLLRRSTLCQSGRCSYPKACP